MSSQLYFSLPLNPSNAEIRTLSILPSADREAPIECSLNVVSLNGECDFEALSYVWHEPSLASTPPVAILVNASSFTPTPNLFSALKHLRLPQKARTLWADAICINQHDDNERNAQVPLMARIYTTAKAVAVWLGPSNNEIDTFYALFGMAEDGSFLPHIDYAKSVETVSTEVATYLLLREKNAELFDSWDYTAPTGSTASPRPPSPVQPSWIPDFHTKVPAFHLDYRIATGSTRNNFISVSKDFPTLSIHARSFGTSKVLAHFTSSTADNMQIFKR
ncbi:heterokaryon incompatibility protein-domain-containing protein [Plectosphaerella plurivora]|uniref:Heterokaryon incompatibility protein-domain-containing protein n=1 Tax=Plectosphaerella plurivora TaxID=936078 RepID=A0A9P8VF83_9PEZI|nr:heterokaryon incompatibility protein-domain-containing protein [Plectosphaerella plurivora]